MAEVACAMQDGTHDLKSLGSGGMRLGPVSLVRAVGRVIRSVVGGDSDDSHHHQVGLGTFLLSLEHQLSLGIVVYLSHSISSPDLAKSLMS